MTSLHPDPPYEKPIPHPQNRFMALTSNCNDIPTLFVDTHAPLDILTDAAGYRFRAVTQVLENLSMRGSIECDSFILRREKEEKGTRRKEKKRGRIYFPRCLGTCPYRENGEKGTKNKFVPLSFVPFPSFSS